MTLDRYGHLFKPEDVGAEAAAAERALFVGWAGGQFFKRVFELPHRRKSLAHRWKTAI
jgi:hypothetical protein